MRINKFIVSSIVISSALTATAEAAEFNGATVRAIGMGGSNIASTKGVDATYWNPAAYGFFGQESELDNNDMASKDFGLDLNASAAATYYGSIAGNLNILQNMSVPTGNTAAGFNNQEIVDTANFMRDFSSLDPSVGGVNAIPEASIGTRFGSFGFGVRLSGDINAKVTFDNFNVGLGGKANVVSAFGGAQLGAGALASPGGYFTAAQQDSMRAQLVLAGYTADEAASVVFKYDTALQQTGAPATDQATNSSSLMTIATSPGDLQQNNTAITTRGLALGQVELTYGQEINDALSVGVVLKYIEAQMVYQTVKAFGASNTLQNTLDASGGDTDASFGLDLGLMYRMEGWQFGLTGKNLNAPSFTDSTGYVYELKPQMKAGAAWVPTDTLTVEAGYDLTENTGVDQTSANQYWNIGMEWDAMSVLALRLGAFENMSSDVGTVYSLGLGMNLWAARLDLALAASPKTENFQGDDIPVYAMASAALAVDF